MATLEDWKNTAGMKNLREMGEYGLAPPSGVVRVSDQIKNRKMAEEKERLAFNKPSGGIMSIINKISGMSSAGNDTNKIQNAINTFGIDKIISEESKLSSDINAINAYNKAHPENLTTPEPVEPTTPAPTEPTPEKKDLARREAYGITNSRIVRQADLNPEERALLAKRGITSDVLTNLSNAALGQNASERNAMIESADRKYGLGAKSTEEMRNEFLGTMFDKMNDKYLKKSTRAAAAANIQNALFGPQDDTEYKKEMLGLNKILNEAKIEEARAAAGLNRANIGKVGAETKNLGLEGRESKQRADEIKSLSVHTVTDELGQTKTVYDTGYGMEQYNKLHGIPAPAPKTDMDILTEARTKAIRNPSQRSRIRQYLLDNGFDPKTVDKTLGK
jgi:hypothetical protein